MFRARQVKVSAQGQKLTIRLVDESGVNDSLVPDVIRKTFSLSRVVLLHLLVVGEGLHHANVSIQWHSPFYPETLIPDEKKKNKYEIIECIHV